MLKPYDPSYSLFCLKRDRAEIAEVLLNNTSYRCHIRPIYYGFKGYTIINTGETCANYIVSRESKNKPYVADPSSMLGSHVAQARNLPLDAPISIDAKAIHDREDLGLFYVEARKSGFRDADEEEREVEQALREAHVALLHFDHQRPHCGFPIQLLIPMGSHDRAVDVLMKLGYEYDLR